MADNQQDRNSEDLSEEASPYRVEEFRSKGQVAQSREVTGLFVLLCAGATVYGLSPSMGVHFTEFMREVFRADLSARADLGSTAIVGETLFKSMKIIFITVAPVCLFGFVMGALGSFVQVGSIFSTDPITPDLKKIDPLAGFKRMFSMKQVIDGFRMTVKMVALTAAAYAVMKGVIKSSPGALHMDTGGLMMSFGSAAKTMFLSLCGVILVFAAMDFGLQRWEFSKQLRLTKQEARQEYKEREGDPQIKARIRSVQREVARRRMMAAVKKADVIVTNPTHIAIAISYEKNDMAAPRVVAKGADFLAQKIRAVAQEAGIPFVENVPLARTLYKTVKVGQVIPRALYQAVAEVLAYVYKLKNRGM